MGMSDNDDGPTVMASPSFDEMLRMQEEANAAGEPEELTDRTIAVPGMIPPSSSHGHGAPPPVAFGPPPVVSPAPAQPWPPPQPHAPPSAPAAGGWPTTDESVGENPKTVMLTSDQWPGYGPPSAPSGAPAPGGYHAPEQSSDLPKTMAIDASAFISGQYDAQKAQAASQGGYGPPATYAPQPGSPAYSPQMAQAQPASDSSGVLKLAIIGIAVFLMMGTCGAGAIAWFFL